MSTIGEYHELVEKLISTADALGSYGDQDGRKIVAGIVDKMYTAQMVEVAKAKIVGKPDLVEKYVVSSYAYIKEWLDESAAN